MKPKVERGAGERAGGGAPPGSPPAAPAGLNAWESALEAWETVLGLAPDHPIARVQRIECLARLKRRDAVVAACTAEPALAVSDEIRFASRLSAGRAFDRALPLWQRIVARAESDEQALTAVRAQLRCFAMLGLRGRKPIVGRLAPWAGIPGAKRRQANVRPRHVAILGVSYCGSTLLSLVLGALPGVANIGESHFLLEPRSKTRESHNLTKDGFEQCVFCGSDCSVITDDLRRRLATQPAAFYEILADALGTEILVSADKNYSHLVRRDPDLQHDAIVLFREPLENWRSQARRSGAVDSDARLKYLKQWAIDYRNFLDNYNPNNGRKIVLNFDDFLNHSKETLNQICQSLELPYAADALEYWRHMQHCVGGNLNVRERLATDDLKALRIAPHARTSRDRSDQTDCPLPREVVAVARRLRKASLRAPIADRSGTSPPVSTPLREGTLVDGSLIARLCEGASVERITSS